MTSPRRLTTATLCLAAALTLTLTACGQAPNSGGTPDPSGEGVLDTSAGSPPTTDAPPPPEPDYPDTPRDYAEAVLDAWEAPADVDRLGELTTAEVQEQLLEVPMPLNFNWHFKACHSVLPNFVCIFFNDNGDRQEIQVSSDLLGEPHAAVQVALDMTEYPTAPVPYAREFADAWRDGNTYRMRRLADDALANELAQEEEPGSGYRACGDGAAGSTYVRIYNNGPEYVLRVSNPVLGNPDAIKDSVPPPNPPACTQLILIPTIIIPPPSG